MRYIFLCVAFFLAHGIKIIQHKTTFIALALLTTTGTHQNEIQVKMELAGLAIETLGAFGSKIPTVTAIAEWQTHKDSIIFTALFVCA